MNERTKDVEIQGRRWQVGRVPADAAVWMFMQLQADPTCKDFAIFTKIKDLLLSRIAVYVEAGGQLLPKSIYAKGTWLCPELALEYDVLTVNELFVAAVDFNIDPFVRSSPKVQ